MATILYNYLPIHQHPYPSLLSLSYPNQHHPSYPSVATILFNHYLPIHQPPRLSISIPIYHSHGPYYPSPTPNQHHPFYPSHGHHPVQLPPYPSAPQLRPYYLSPAPNKHHPPILLVATILYNDYLPSPVLTIPPTRNQHQVPILLVVTILYNSLSIHQHPSSVLTIPLLPPATYPSRDVTGQHKPHTPALSSFLQMSFFRVAFFIRGDKATIFNHIFRAGTSPLLPHTFHLYS